VGEDVRVAYDMVKGELPGIDNMQPADQYKENTVLAFILNAIEEKMRKPGFPLSDVRKARLAQNLSPITESEKAWINYNAFVGRKGEELLYGLQDHIDPKLNAAFTQGIRIITNDLRQNMLNIFIMRTTIEAKAPQAAIGRELSGKFDKKYGISTGVLYFENTARISDQLSRALDMAASPDSEGKYPKIFIECLNKEELDMANKAIGDAKKDKSEDERKKLDDMIAIARDFRDEVEMTGLNIPYEIRVITIGSAIMNDKRLSEVPTIKAEDLFDSRRTMLTFLSANKVISEEDFNKISNLKPVDAYKLNAFMNDIWTGAISLNCTRIDWKKLDEWKKAQRQLLQSV
jgi:hypothetical protein